MTDVTRIGFVGTGTIAEAMVTGLLTAPSAAVEITVSPRNREVAARLAAKFPGLTVASDNQAVVDAADLVVLAVRPQIAAEVVPALRFRAGQAVLSLIAATDRDTLLGWTGGNVTVTQAVPLPFVAKRQGVTALYPPDATVEALFSKLGTAVACQTRQEYDLLAAGSTLMGSYFGILETAESWLKTNGLPEDKARAYLAALFSSLSQTTATEETKAFSALRHEFSTPDGLNEQVFTTFDRNGGTDALRHALDGVLARITG